MRSKVFNNEIVSVQEFVYQRLRTNIVNCAYRPGQHLCINLIADNLGVSPTPVREALQRLYKESLITVTPNRGFFTLVPSQREVHDLFSTLNMCLQAALVVSVASLCHRQSNFATNVRPHQNSSHSKKTEIIEQNLVTIGQRSSNGVLLETIENLVSRTHAIRSIDLESDQVFDTEASAHEIIQGHCAAGRTSDCTSVLNELHESQQRRLPGLVKEAVSRMYGN